MRLSIFSSAVLALVACFGAHAQTAAPAAASASAAAPAASGQVVAEAAPKRVCHRETPTGSNVSVTRCRNPDEDATRDAVRDDLVRLNGAGGVAASNGFSKGN